MGAFERSGAGARRLSSRAVRRIVVMASVVAVALAAIGSVASADAGKTALIHFSQDTFTAGSSPTFTVRLTNESTQQQLGSANLLPPAGFIATAAGPSAIANVDTVNNVVQLRNLSIPPGGSSPLISITMTAPCSATQPLLWQAFPKQSNNYNGPPGNAVGVDSASNLAVTLTGGCKLQFETQPADAYKGTTITTTPLDAVLNSPLKGGPIVVDVVDSSTAALITSSTAPITISIASATPSGGTFSTTSTTTVKAVAGRASFSDLSIATPAAYTLQATSSGMTPSLPSSSFTIWQNVTSPCTQCSLSGKTTNENLQLTGTSTSTGVLVAQLGVDSITCPNDPYQHAPVTATVSSFNFTSTGKLVTVVINKTYVNAQPNNGAAFYQVCYSTQSVPQPLPSDPTFTDRSGNTVTLGLLPDCKNVSNVPPCVQSITKDNAGNVVEKILLPASDPKFH